MLVEENTVSVAGLAWVRALGCAGGWPRGVAVMARGPLTRVLLKTTVPRGVQLLMNVNYLVEVLW